MDEAVRQFLENEHHLKIGRGGFAEVFEATTAGELGVACALKVSLDPLDKSSDAADTPHQQTLHKEIENLKSLRWLTGYPNVVTLMDVWLVGGYLVTRWELATEGSLLDVLARYQQQGQQGIPLSVLFRYMTDAAEGIDFLNKLGVYHRDIKPQNLLVFHGRVKVGDLGLAKLAGASTASHTGGGTLGYLPPEAYGEHRLSQTVDVYSLAATYIKLRTGREPFGDNPREAVKRQEEGQPVLDGLTRREAQVVQAALAPKPEDRPRQGAVRFVKALRNALEPPAAPAALPAQPSGPQTAQQVPAQRIRGASVGAIRVAIEMAIYGAIAGAISAIVEGISSGIKAAIVAAILGPIFGAIVGAIVGAIGGAIYGAIEGAKKAKS
ncbi:MAG: hypothetical protein C4297_13685 [Gemmataceae bacterium]